jgi:DNA-binding GntR family transcriptional regulator
MRAREAIDQAITALRDARMLLLIARASGGGPGGAGESRLAEAEARIEEARALVAAGQFDEAERLLDRIHDSIASLRSGRNAGIY